MYSVNTKIGGLSSKMHENSPIFLVTLEVFIYEATCWSNNSFEQLVAFRDTLIRGELILAGCMFFVVSLGGARTLWPKAMRLRDPFSGCL